MKSPITGEMIPVEEMSEHMRISLIDPRHRSLQLATDTTACNMQHIACNV